MSTGVDVLNAIDDAISRNIERGAAKGSPSDRSLREARAAIAELIEAGTHFDKWDTFETQQRFRKALRRVRGAA